MIGGYKVVVVEDYQSSQRMEAGNVTTIDLPKSNVLKYYLEDGYSSPYKLLFFLFSTISIVISKIKAAPNENSQLFVSPAIIKPIRDTDATIEA